MNEPFLITTQLYSWEKGKSKWCKMNSFCKTATEVTALTLEIHRGNLWTQGNQSEGRNPHVTSINSKLAQEFLDRKPCKAQVFVIAGDVTSSMCFMEKEIRWKLFSLIQDIKSTSIEKPGVDPGRTLKLQTFMFSLVTITIKTLSRKVGFIFRCQDEKQELLKILNAIKQQAEIWD